MLLEIVGTERRVSEVVRQRIPSHQTGDGERPMAERAATMSWYDEMVAAGRSNRWRLATSDVGWQQFTKYWGALPWIHGWTVTPSLWRIHYGTPSQCSSEWSRCVKPRSLPSITDDTGCGIQQTCGSDFKKIGGTSRRHVDVDIAPGLNVITNLTASARNQHISGFYLA